MTEREKAIVMAYTGCTMLAGDKLDIFYQYVKEKLGRSVMTHELAYEEVQDAIKEAAKEDFIEIAKADNGWISVKERLPELHRYEEDGDTWLMSEPVLVATAKGLTNGYYEDDLDPKFKPCWNDVEHGEKIKVTHWMELPERPKK